MQLENMAWVEAVGYLAAGAGLYSSYARTMIPLRMAAIAANVLFISYGLLKGIYPTILVNCILLPLNFIRLRDMRSLITRVHSAADGDLNIDWLRPYLTRKHYKAGDFLWRKGDAATEAAYILDGQVILVELRTTVGKGALIGEMGLFDSRNQRTASVKCLTDVEVGTITYDQFRILYYQNPEFGFYLLRLVTGRMQDNLRTLGQGSSSQGSGNQGSGGNARQGRRQRRRQG